jgi:adenine-specific DNA methylase
MSHNAKESVRQGTMMSPLDFTDVGSDMTALILGVMQTNLRTMLEYSRVESPQALADLQRRFAREYLAALQQGVMTLVSALRPGAN